MSTFVFAETCVFGKQSLEPISCGLLTPHRSEKLLRHPFFRRYGVNLPSSLTEGRSFTWGEFPLPTSVGMRYGRTVVWREAFLDGLGADDFRPVARTRSPSHALCIAAFPTTRTSGGKPILSIRWVHLPYRVPPLLITTSSGAGLPTCLPSPTAITLSA